MTVRIRALIGIHCDLQHMKMINNTMSTDQNLIWSRLTLMARLQPFQYALQRIIRTRQIINVWWIVY